MTRWMGRGFPDLSASRHIPDLRGGLVRLQTDWSTISDIILAICYCKQ
jgi:hypothetical protein